MESCGAGRQGGGERRTAALKAFPWYHDNKLANRFKNLRVALRRWLIPAWANHRLGA